MPRGERTPIALTGGPGILVRHSAMGGIRRQPIRRFEVSIPHRYAQYDATVVVWYMPPKARTLRGVHVVPNNWEFCTIERGGCVVYDSRSDVPCDMAEWERLHREWGERDR